MPPHRGRLRRRPLALHRLAVGLFNPKLKAFKLADMDSAMAHVGIPEPVRRLVKRRIDALYGEIGRESA